jgi:hypothetical protein
MDSYGIYKLIRPSRRSGKRLRIYVEWTCDKEMAMVRAREAYERVCGDVEAVEVVDYATSSPAVIYRLDDESRKAS